MYNRINENLSQSRQELFRVKKIEAMLETLEREVAVLEHKANAAETVLEKENRDYDKMTEFSVSSIFYSVLGKLEERAEKERREALEAELKYNQAVQELRNARGQIVKLKNELASLGNVQKNYESLYKQKLQMLMDENSFTAQKIMELNGRMESCRNNMKEIDEARAVGIEILRNLEEAMKCLENAEGWGVWDMMGGGLIADMAKHSHIDDAGHYVNRAQSLIRNFRAELADISISDEINIEIDGFSKFADFFFDGLIADWFMQNKINATQENVRGSYDKVKSVMMKLDDLKTAEQKIIDGLKNKLDGVVINE